MAEVLREPTAHLHTELARRYAGEPASPPSGASAKRPSQAITVWQWMWELYWSCLEPLLEGEAPRLAGVKAKLLQRGLHVGKQLVLVHGLARRVAAPSLWQELHAYYRLAEMLDCAVIAVSDDATPNAVGISCYSTYVHALLLALADPYGMTVGRSSSPTAGSRSGRARCSRLRAATRDRRTGDRRRPGRRVSGRAPRERAADRARVDALRLSRQARDQACAGASSASGRCDAGGARARERSRP